MMTKLREIYRCRICGNIVEVLHTGAGALVCCGEEMELLEEKTKDSSTEKHIPYVEKTEHGVIVKVGQNENHPMIGKHFIEWIQVITDGASCRKYLNPGDRPEAEFNITTGKIEAREYCNIHGLWKS